MKKILFTLTLVLASSVNAFAQNLYKTVLDRATEVVNNPASAKSAISISQFKIEVLNYITSEMKKQGIQKDSYFYDSQAVNLESFLSDYQENLAKAKNISGAKASELKKIYKEATLNNPLFNDSNKEQVNAHLNNAASETPFSIDTDWENAYDEATRKAKTLLK